MNSNVSTHCLPMTAPAVLIKERPDAKKLLAWLCDPVNFAHAFLKAGGEPVHLDPWQVSYLRNPAKFVCLLKSRRVGGSWIMALKFFLRSQTRARYNAFFVSMNREEARGKIDYVDELHDSLPPRWKLRRLNRSKDEISFASPRGTRSVIRSLAGKAPRGRGGDVGLSELPHCINSKAIYEGALHVTARGKEDHLTVESTPLGKHGVFHDLSRGKFGEFVRYEVPWWLCSSLCDNVDEASRTALSMPTSARVKKYGSGNLKKIYAAMDERAFRQESEIEFVEVEDAAFPVEIITSCAQVEFGPGPESALAFRKIDRAPSALDWEWLRSARKGALFIGCDPGRKNDQCAIVILDLAGAKLETRMVVSLKDTPFSIQKETLESAIRLGATALRMDATGIGMDMAERLERAFPKVAEGVTFTAKSKAMLIAGGYNSLRDKRVVIPAERDLIGQLAAIRQVASQSGSILYVSSRNSSGHADIAWAWLLALEGARGISERHVTEYRSVARRRSAPGF
ncbi:MAG: hypothetical protein HQK86_07630 [Nitrospinae bacterium]|nr:hypothetical protein [Nitrospinota bacterium]